MQEEHAGIVVSIFQEILMPPTLKRRLPELKTVEPAPNAALSMLAPVGRETLQEQVYLQLRQALMVGRFRPGQALTLRSVAEALGVSHMPVRGALQRLEAEGALNTQFTRRTLNIPELRLVEMEELRDIRVELEGLATERAAKNVTKPELEEIGRRVQRMQASAETGDIEGYIVENWAFHTAVYQASHMPQLLTLVEGLWLRIGPYVRFMLPDRESMLASMPNHHEIFEALQRRDAKSARKSIAADISDCAECLRGMLKP
jgi:DNA-binding GntR family transcriptional regulator